MFEYRKYPRAEKVTINPKMIVSIHEDSADITKICLLDGNSILVQVPYKEVVDQFNGYMYSIQTIVSVR